jgi:hypothetical protein
LPVNGKITGITYGPAALEALGITRAATTAIAEANRISILGTPTSSRAILSATLLTSRTWASYHPETTFAGRRIDRLKVTPDGFRVLRRDMLLVHYVLPRTISVFF